MALPEQIAVAFVRRPRLAALTGLLVVALALTWGLIASDGLVRGHDAAINSYSGYESDNATWLSLWDDLRFPGMPRPATRTTLTQFVLIWLSGALNSYTDAARLMQAGMVLLSMVTMFALVRHYTGSNLAGFAAALVAVVNRAAPFQSQLAFAAGFALAPLAFLALDRTLRYRRPRDAMFLGVAVALLVVSTILPFTYIVASFLTLYAVIYGLSIVRRSTWPEVPDVLRQLLRPLGLAGVVAFFLAFYFLSTLALSTGQVISEESGYSLDEISRRAVTLWQAITLEAAGGFIFDTWWMGVANFLLALAAVAAFIRLRTYWTSAFMVIVLVSVFFASQVDSPVYAFIFERVPLFSLVRIGRRWEALTLLSYVVLASTFVPLAWDLAQDRVRRFRSSWRASWQLRRPRGSLKRAVRPALTNASALVVTLVVLPLAVVVHWNSVAEWLETYQLPGDYIAPYAWLAEIDDDSVIAAAPFLETRVTDKYSLITGDYSRHLGPSVAGRPLLTGFRVGGITVNADIRALISNMETAPAFSDDLVEAHDSEEIFVSRRWKNFFIEGAIGFSDSSEGQGVVRVNFRRQSERVAYAVEFDEAAQEVRLSLTGANSRVMDRAPFEFAAGRSYTLAIAAQDSHFRVYIDGERVLTGADTTLARGEIGLEAEGARATLTNVRMTSVNEPIFVDTGFMNKLALLNTGHLVLQPHASPEEKALLASLPGFELQFSSGDAAVGANTLNYPRIGAPARVGLVVSKAVPPVLDTLAKLPGFNFEDNLLLFLDDLGEAELGLVSPLIDYIVIADTDDAFPSSLEGMIDRGVPVVYLLAPPEPQFTRASEGVFLVDDITVDDGAQDVVDRNWRVFVFEADVRLGEGTSQAGVRFKQRNANAYYYVELDGATNRVTLGRRQGSDDVALAQTRVRGLASESRALRIAMDGPSVDVYLDGDLILQGSDELFNRGTISIYATGGEAEFTSLRSTSPPGASPDFRFLSRYGFEATPLRAVTVGLTPGAETPGVTRSVTHRAAMTIEIPRSGRYAVTIGLRGSEVDAVFSTVTNLATGDVELLSFDGGLARSTAYTNQLTHEENGDLWITDGPVRISAGAHEITVFAQGRQPLIEHVMLTELRGRLAEPDPLTLFSRNGADSDVDFEKVSPTEYRVLPDGGEGRFIVFKDSFDAGWVASDSVGELEHLRAYGFYNAYLVPANLAKDATIKISYRPQAVYTSGLVISALTVPVLIAVGWLWSRRRSREAGTPAEMLAQADGQASPTGGADTAAPDRRTSRVAD